MLTKYTHTHCNVIGYEHMLVWCESLLFAFVLLLRGETKESDNELFKVIFRESTLKKLINLDQTISTKLVDEYIFTTLINGKTKFSPQVPNTKSKPIEIDTFKLLGNVLPTVLPHAD